MKFDFDFQSFWDRFWRYFASPHPPDPPKSAQVSFLQTIRKSIRNRSALKVAPRSPQERPRPSQDAPRTPPESPRPPQEASRTPPGRPQMPSRTPPDDPKCFSEASGPKKSNSSKKGRKKKSTMVIHGGHSHRPLKNRKHFHNCRTPEGGGGGRAKRSYNNITT